MLLGFVHQYAKTFVEVGMLQAHNSSPREPSTKFSTTRGPVVVTVHLLEVKNVVVDP